MTRNQLRMNVFVKTIMGLTIAAFEWAIFVGFMAFAVSYLLLPIVTVNYPDDHATSFIYKGMTAMCSFIGLLLGLNIKASLIMWRILPMNKKAAKRFITNQKQELEKKISKREELIMAIEKDYQNKILIIDEEVEQNKNKLQELISLEDSL